MKPLRHVLLALGLVFALAFGQQAAALHGLGHATELLSQHQEDDSDCDQHWAFSTVGNALDADGPAVPLVHLDTAHAAVAAASSASLPLRYCFLSRAPPAASLS